MKNNRKYISIVIVATFLSVFTMIFYFDIKYYLDSNNKSLQGSKESYLKDEKEVQDTLEKEMPSEKEEQNNNNKDIILEVEDNGVKNRTGDEVVNNNYKNIDNIQDNDSIKMEETGSLDKDKFNDEVTSIFKVDKNSIISEISNIDKLKIIKMSNRLSVDDYKELANNIKRSDELLAATDIFRLLKSKLSNRDYRELTMILSPYINIEIIENKINEK